MRSNKYPSLMKAPFFFLAGLLILIARLGMQIVVPDANGLEHFERNVMSIMAAFLCWVIAFTNYR